MQLITSAAAVPAIALGQPMPALAAAKPDRKAWDEAHTRFNLVNAEYDRRIAVEEAACEAVFEECPRVDRFFDEYHLSMGMKRETVVRIVSYEVADRVGLNGLVVYPPDKAKECDEKIRLMQSESERVADEFAAYQYRRAEAWKKHRVDELRLHAEEYRPLYFEARDALMKVPAPDLEALWIKFEIAGDWLGEEYVAGAFADARRFLGVVH